MSGEPQRDASEDRARLRAALDVVLRFTDCAATCGSHEDALFAMADSLAVEWEQKDVARAELKTAIGLWETILDLIDSGMPTEVLRVAATEHLVVLRQRAAEAAEDDG